MTLISLLLAILFIAIVGYVAYWLIVKFIPVGIFRTVSLAIVGILLLIVLLSQVGLLGGASAILATPVT